MLVTLNCPNCGAALPRSSSRADVVTCEYCNTTFRVPKSLTPEPDMGDLLLGADFSRKPILGWQFQNEDKITLAASPAPELRVKFGASDLVHYMLQTSGVFDNLDASVTVRFLAGEVGWIRVALFLRYTPGPGGYGFFISAQGTYMFGYYEKPADSDLAWRTIMDWTSHAALRSGLEQPNRLRVVANGKRIQVYLNGVMATSFQDTRFEVGQVRLAVEPSGKSAAEVAFSDLQLREVK